MFMSSMYNIYEQFASVAIGKLMEREYLLDDLDWDVKGGKYTLRIRGADRSPMVAVGLLTFRRKDNMIVAINAVTGEKTEFSLIAVVCQSNIEDFLDFICEYAQKLREEAAYR